MRPGLFLLRAYLNAYRKISEFLAHKLRRNFYLYLAALFSLFVLLDVLSSAQIVDMRQKSPTTWWCKNRFMKPKPDRRHRHRRHRREEPGGRWQQSTAAGRGRVRCWASSWSTCRMQAPKAVIFDILFSDPDVFNPDSDAYLDERRGCQH